MTIEPACVPESRGFRVAVGGHLPGLLDRPAIAHVGRNAGRSGRLAAHLFHRILAANSRNPRSQPGVWQSVELQRCAGDLEWVGYTKYIEDKNSSDRKVPSKFADWAADTKFADSSVGRPAVFARAIDEVGRGEQLCLVSIRLNAVFAVPNDRVVRQ